VLRKVGSLVAIRARLVLVESLFLVVWFVIAVVFLVWIVHEWMDVRHRHHK
jgi:hypothetical protein